MADDVIIFAGTANCSLAEKIAGERVYVPPYTTVEIEYERAEDEVVEIELKWKRRQD